MKLTTEEFVSRSVEVHGNKYDYSRSKYTKWTDKVTIVCYIHGEFQQRADAHMHGQGCAKCFGFSRKNIDDFIDDFNKVHNYKYDYSASRYINATTKIEIVCPLHGSFMQLASQHRRGQGCPKCCIDKSKSTLTLSKEEFINRANLVHNHKYDYSKTVYTGKNSKIIIICPIHGEYLKIASEHIRGRGCTLCCKNASIKSTIEAAILRYGNKYDISQSGSVSCKLHGALKITAGELLKQRGCKYCKRDSKEAFIKKSKKLFSNSFDYENLNYVNASTPVDLICKKHGLFSILPNHHLSYGCPKCKIGVLIAKLNLVHGEYEYHFDTYPKCHDKIEVTCKLHGKFTQTLSRHKSGRKCPKCVYTNLADGSRKDLNLFIEQANYVHNGRYTYDKTQYTNNREKILVNCKLHGEFYVSPHDHLHGCGCQKCNISTGQYELYEFIKSTIGGDVRLNDRDVIHPYEIDIFLPSMGIGVEYHGLYWHSYDTIESYDQRHAHNIKYEHAAQNGIRLFQFFEHEWMDKKDVVKSILSNQFGLTSKVHGRECKVAEINDDYDFFQKSHLQGWKWSDHSFGLYYDGKLISCMTFSAHNEFDLEIIRYATLPGYRVVGGASKLLHKAIRVLQPRTVLTYADKRYSTGNVYQKLGFIKLGETRPNYFYTKGRKIYSRISFQKHKLPSILHLYDSGLTEAENMFNNGYRRLWDAGHHKLLLNT